MRKCLKCKISFPDRLMQTLVKEGDGLCAVCQLRMKQGGDVHASGFSNHVNITVYEQTKQWLKDNPPTPLAGFTLGPQLNQHT